MQKREELIVNIESLIDSIQSLYSEIESKLYQVPWLKNVSSNIYLLWRRDLKDQAINVITSIKDRITFYSTESLQKVSDVLSSFFMTLHSFSNLLDNENSNFETLQRILSDSYELFLSFPDEVKRYEYDNNIFLTTNEFIFILNEIKERYGKIDSEDNYLKLYISSDEKDKEYISRKIIEFRNQLTTDPRNTKNLDLDYFKNELEYLLNKDKVISSVANIIDSNTIANNFKENLSVIFNSDFASEYEKLADKLDKEAANINYFIIFLFVIITLLIVVKLIYTSLYNIVNFTLISATWLTLVLSISALIAYLIKERKRVNNLRDYYRVIQIELTALPKYIGELNANQRIEMLVHLSTNYFKGTSISSRIELKNDENILKDNSNLIEKVLDISKNLSNDKK